MLKVTAFSVGSAYAHQVYVSENKFQEMTLTVKDTNKEYGYMDITLTPMQADKVAKYAASLVLVDPMIDIDWEAPLNAFLSQESHDAFKEEQRAAKEAEQQALIDETLTEPVAAATIVEEDK